jgi:propanediol utilization protein
LIPALRRRFSAAHFSIPSASAISVKVTPFISHLSAKNIIFLNNGKLLNKRIVKMTKKLNIFRFFGIYILTYFPN